LPNSFAEYDKALVTLQVPDKTERGRLEPLLGPDDKAVVTQKVMDDKEDKKSLWFDGTERRAKGIFWVLKKNAGEKTVVVGQVGDQAVESQLHNHQRAYINIFAILVTLIVTVILVKGIS